MSGYIINLNLNPSLELPKTPEFDQPILRLFFLFKGFFKIFFCIAFTDYALCRIKHDV